MLGSGYLIDHVIAAFRAKQEELSFRIYVTDTLKMIAENTTRFVGMEGVVDYGYYPQARWCEVLEPKESEAEPEDTRSCEEITAGIFARARITRKQGDTA